jgi:hypothetical protein
MTEPTITPAPQAPGATAAPVGTPTVAAPTVAVPPAEVLAPEAAPAPALPPMPTEPPTTRRGGARPPRRKLRAALRWTAAALVFAALGSAATYEVTRPERTKIPGLRTPDDGRWTFPPYALPKLPAGKPRALDTDDNTGGHHYADLHSLLLPAPLTAVPGKALPGKTGWLATDAFVQLYDQPTEDRTAEVLYLKDNGLRHIAAEEWTTPDGTRTDVYLLQFISSAYINSPQSEIEPQNLKGVAHNAPDNSVHSDVVPVTISVSAFGETKPDSQDTRYAYIRSGDVLALVTQSRKGGPPLEVPFRQTVRLQAQLLG